MIEKVTVKSIDTRSGVSKTGRGYDIVTMETSDDRKMFCYIDKEWDMKFNKLTKISAWKEGDEVTVKTEQNGDYLNFDIVTNKDRLEELEERVSLLEEAVKNAQKKKL